MVWHCSCPACGKVSTDDSAERPRACPLCGSRRVRATAAPEGRHRRRAEPRKRSDRIVRECASLLATDDPDEVRRIRGSVVSLASAELPTFRACGQDGMERIRLASVHAGGVLAQGGYDMILDMMSGIRSRDLGRPDDAVPVLRSHSELANLVVHGSPDIRSVASAVRADMGLSEAVATVFEDAGDRETASSIRGANKVYESLLRAIEASTSRMTDGDLDSLESYWSLKDRTPLTEGVLAAFLVFQEGRRSSEIDRLIDSAVHTMVSPKD